jgi:hypothetical protein
MNFFKNISTNCTNEAMIKIKLTSDKNSKPSGFNTRWYKPYDNNEEKKTTNIVAKPNPMALLIFFDTPKKGQVPKKRTKTTLDTNIADMIKVTMPIISILVRLSQSRLLSGVFYGKK